MKQARLDSLADGIFAIVMTLLVLEIRVPHLDVATNTTIWGSILNLLPFFLSFVLSFVLLFTYWRGHHAIASVLAKNIDHQLTNINALFFLFVTFVPFSALLLGLYNDTQIAIAFYGLNVVALGLSLYWMRRYIRRSPSIVNEFQTEMEFRHGTTRILFPVYVAVVAIVISFFSTTLSLFLFTIAILFNLSSYSTTYTHWLIDLLRGRKPRLPQNHDHKDQK